MTWMLPVFVAVVAAAIVKWIWKRRNLHTTWERLGVPGPKPSSLLFGNLWEMSIEGRFPISKKWTKTYGKVFGFYEGEQPVLEVADPDMAREILIKHFDNFEHRTVIFDNSEVPYVSMGEAKGEKWRRVRRITTPIHSAKKMKMLSPLVNKSVDKLLNRFESRVQENKDFDIQGDLKCLTLDAIASTAFGYEIDIFNQQDTEFFKRAKTFFDYFDLNRMSTSSKAALWLFRLFPSLVRIAQFFSPRITALDDSWFLDLAKKMITERQASGEFRPDYMQAMLDVVKELQGTQNSSESGTNSDLKQELTGNYLTMEEMQAQVSVFLVAGFESTAVTLSLIAYYLALYPGVQTKLQNEIDKHFPDSTQEVNYETVQLSPYLDMVFCEISRLIPVGILGVQRDCNETIQIGNTTIPKGVKVMINIEDLHMNPDLWGPEPVNEFVPERFLPERKAERHPMAYLPFGAGPRMCVGMRFADLEIKITLVRIMQRYSFVRGDQTKVPLKFSTDGALGPVDGVFVKLQKRK